MSDRSPLTVAIVSSPADWGGGEEQARLLAHGLRARGHRAAILARRGGALAARMRDAGFEVFEFAGRGRSPIALWRIRRHLRGLRPDVLHFNDSHALLAAGPAGAGLRVPLRIAARRVGFPLRSALVYNLLADRVVCVSLAAVEASRQGGIPAERLRLVHDGVDPSHVRSGDRRRGREALGVADRQQVILTVAKLTECKGHTFLLYALPRVLARRPDAVAVLAGDGPLREPLQDQAVRLGIGDRVRFIGFRRDVPDLIQAADLFVLPSVSEGLCSTLIDVMLAGRPIAATTAGGVPDLTAADDPQSEPVAWSVPPRNAPALAGAILEALASPDQSAARAARARIRAESLFTADRMVEQTLAIYREGPGR